MSNQPTFAKADLHIHTRFSYDSMAHFRAIVKQALKKGISIIAITDHDTIEGAQKFEKYIRKNKIPLQVIIGEEVSSLGGHVLGLFLKEHIPPFLSLRETIKRIKAQGGTVIIPHPGFSKIKPPERIFRVRVHYSELLEDPDLLRQVDGIEAANFSIFDNKLTHNVNTYAKHFNKALIGSSDAHISHHVGTVYTIFDGSTIDDLRKALLLKTTRSVTDRDWTIIDWIWHHLSVIKIPFAFIYYNLINLIKKGFFFLYGKVFTMKNKETNLQRIHSTLKKSPPIQITKNKEELST